MGILTFSAVWLLVGLARCVPQGFTEYEIVSSYEPGPTATTILPVPTTIPVLPTPTNPYGADCPVPSNFVINNFSYTWGPTPPMSPFDGQINISYGDLNLKCPTRPGAWSYHYGMVVMECDDAGIVQAIWELGTSYVEVVGKMWCSGLPQPITNGTLTNQTDFSSLGIRTGFHNLDTVLTCIIPDTQNPTVRRCTQTLANYSMPVSSFFATTSTSVSFTPISRGGAKVDCPTIVGVNPIIDDESSCTHIGGATSITDTKVGTAKVGKRSVRKKLRNLV